MTGDAAAILAELKQAPGAFGFFAPPLSAHIAPRLGLADELITVSASTGRPIDGLIGLAWRTVDLFLAGDRRAARSLGELREHLVMVRCDGLSYLVAALDVMLDARGQLTEAEELADRCYALGVEVGDANALGWYGAPLVAIRWLQGRHPARLVACRRGLAAVRPSSIWSATMLGAGDAAYLLGDAEAAGDAYELLEPYADCPSWRASPWPASARRTGR